jgi:hypothetical protein
VKLLSHVVADLFGRSNWLILKFFNNHKQARQNNTLILLACHNLALFFLSNLCYFLAIVADLEYIEICNLQTIIGLNDAA